MRCANCGADRDPAAPACANCGRTIEAPPVVPATAPGSQVLLAIVLGFVGICSGVFLGVAMSLVCALAMGSSPGASAKPFAEPLAIGVQVLVILAIALGSIRAFTRRAYPVGRILAGVALGAIGPAAACTSLLFSSGGR